MQERHRLSRGEELHADRRGRVPRQLPLDPAFAERTNNIVHWSQFDRGGHFAAMDAPDLLVDDLRVFFRRFRS